jgi:hypothetical protein
MMNNNFTDAEISAAVIALKIEDDLNYQITEGEILLFVELSRKSSGEIRQRIKTQIFLERKCREEYDQTQSRNRRRLMFFILMLIAMLSKEKSSSLCNYFDSQPSNGGSGMGFGL